jgi:hypothetical protein
VSREGSVWLSFATAYGTGAAGDAWIAARRCQIDAATGRLRRQDELAEPGSYHVFPNLVVDPAGTLTLIASRSAPREHPSLYYRIWPTSGPARTGVLVAGRGPPLRCRGNRPCNQDGARNGWGDYNGIGLDPVDERTVWASGGIGHEADRMLWATAIVEL